MSTRGIIPHSKHSKLQVPFDGNTTQTNDANELCPALQAESLQYPLACIGFRQQAGNCCLWLHSMRVAI